MGLAMANNLIKAGYKVVVWNRNPAKCAPLEAAGAEVASSASEVASKAEITFAMLSDPPAALAVAEDVAKGLSPGKGYVDVSTVDSDTSSAIAAKARPRVRAAGGLFLEAPVSGSKGPAEQGQLIFLCAGDAALFDAAAGPLDVMGKKAFFLGEVRKPEGSCRETGV
ncbi:hypothetical protein MNEG_9191 [Monoraphidium neglectum]|uniref:6-phosphogluconate dehydrogenase NADP-binding domain-containing protein n=1 Tax=Monoraphidium neglectum TaxID=145388 RepID=A0A0D2KTH1_9CHLO|nr:hypothetical protein MNEG_9191 [Monoraphidium neglectum]KIY98768.1 hypothetical protein MNEG_9191 [Monoraphidium neglectum]|eukprot:XP_013897788.1 hypothetical protein MNEG_9191 [Monoraphidium neglectum]